MPAWLDAWANLRARPAPAGRPVEDEGDLDEDQLNEFRKFGAKLRRAQYLEVRGGLLRADHTMQVIQGLGAKFREASDHVCEECQPIVGRKLDEYEEIVNTEYDRVGQLSDEDQGYLEADQSDHEQLLAEESGAAGDRADAD